MSAPTFALNPCQKAFLPTQESNRMGDMQCDTRTMTKALQTQLSSFLALPDVQKAMGGQWSLAWGRRSSRPRRARRATRTM